MATFSQGIELISITSIESTSGGGTDSYTVPSGHYAVVEYSLFETGTVSVATINFNGGYISSNGSASVTGAMIVASGVISVLATAGSTGSSSAVAGIMVYKNP